MSAQELLEQWLAIDRNEVSRSYLRKLQDEGNEAEIQKVLGGKRISFGTAGLRALMAPGFAHMNDVTVIQTTQGVCDYLLRTESKARSQGVIIGHDHRHNSERFSRLAAAAFLRRGIKVYYLSGNSCTPLVPFGINELGCAAGIMITASHNPKDDNGYKLYWGNGVQIISPLDTDIAQTITEPRNLQVEEDAWQISVTEHSDLIQDCTERIKFAYLDYVGSLLSEQSRKMNAFSNLQLVYTAMHGVGTPFIQSVFLFTGFPPTALHIVPAQAKADPDFPTVKFPNPEEEGALSESCRYADALEGKDGRVLVLANDPDADRFTAAEKHDGQWRQFSGDQIGAMLGVWLFRKYKHAERPIEKLAMLASTVSSKMLETVAKKEGFRFEETLTGFKFLGNAALDLAKEGYSAEFAYEEAIGYACGTRIRDKDGISAFLTFASMAAALDREDKTLSGYLDELYKIYGYHETKNHYYICRSPSLTERIFSQLRFQADSSPLNATHKDLNLPKTLAGLPITFLRDLTIGYDSSKPDLLPTFPISKSSHMISFTAGQDSSAVKVSGTIRTSGTEPKIKVYIEGRGEDRALVQETLGRVKSAIGTEWLKWEENGLESS